MTGDLARVESIREQLRKLAPGWTPGRAPPPFTWSFGADDAGMLIEARDDTLGAPPVELVRASRFATADEMAFLADAPAHCAFLLSLFDRAMEAGLAGRASRAKPPPALRQAQDEGGGAADTAPHGEPVEPRGVSASPPKDYSAEAAMKCAESAFADFLAAQYGLERPLSQERVAQKLRALCGVKSRAELNGGGAPLEHWKRIRAEYREWAG